MPAYLNNAVSNCLYSPAVAKTLHILLVSAFGCVSLITSSIQVRTLGSVQVRINVPLRHRHLAWPTQFAQCNNFDKRTWTFQREKERETASIKVEIKTIKLNDGSVFDSKPILSALKSCEFKSENETRQANSARSDRRQSTKKRRRRFQKASWLSTGPCAKFENCSFANCSFKGWCEKLRTSLKAICDSNRARIFVPSLRIRIYVAFIGKANQRRAVIGE